MKIQNQIENFVDNTGKWNNKKICIVNRIYTRFDWLAQMTQSLCLGKFLFAQFDIYYLRFSSLFYFHDWSFNCLVAPLVLSFFLSLHLFIKLVGIYRSDINLSNCLALLVSVYSTALSAQDQLHIWQSYFLVYSFPPFISIVLLYHFQGVFSSQTRLGFFSLLVNFALSTTKSIFALHKKQTTEDVRYRYCKIFF